MFTGIIEETGKILALGDEAIRVQAEHILKDVALGDSISVDGICLTVVSFDHESFTAGLSAETVRRTTLRFREIGDRVNLESALRAGGKLGGHIVSGHIDGVGQCLAVNTSGAAWEIDFEAPSTVSRYVVEKGSIAIDGVSLTVAECNSTGDWLRIAVIPHSFSETNLSRLGPGTPVNLEADMIGKYVEKLLGKQGPVREESLSLEFLTEHGFA